MNNLFKRSVASLALVGAMTGSLFGGNAAYIDVRVNYLSGTGKATLGYESWSSTDKAYKAGARKDLAELYIRVLDKDGEFADKDDTGAALIDMKITRSGNPVDNFSTGSGVKGTGTIVSNVVTRGVTSTIDDDSKAIANKNAARYTLDYTKHDTASLLDSLHIVAGNLGKDVNVNLMSLDAKGLIVRITTRDILSSTGGILNEQFTNIKVSGAGNLSVQATELPQITVGQKVPLRIYASNAAVTTDKSNGPSSGRFTSSEALNGKTIVVVAVGDYNVSGTTGTYISETELIMNQGIAKGNIVINYGLPEKNTTGVNGNTDFGTANVGGLGVAFIAYIKDMPSVSNNGKIALSNGVLRTDKTQNLAIAGNDNDSDSLKVKSGPITGFKVGTFNIDGARHMASTYFTDTSNVFVANSLGLTGLTLDDTDENITVMAVDKFGNPGTIITALEPTKRTIGPSKATVSGETADYIDGNISGTYFDINGTDNNLTTDTSTGITRAYFDVTDKNGSSAEQEAVKKTVNIYFKRGELEGTSPATFTVTTLDVIGETPEAIKGPLRGKIGINITGNNKIYTEHKTESDKSDMKVYIKVAEISDNNITLTIKTLNEEGEIDNSKFEFNNTATGLPGAMGKYSADTTRGFKVEINGSSPAITIGKGLVGTIKFLDLNASFKLNTYDSLVGTTTVLTLKGSASDNSPDNNLSHRKYVDAYVKTTVSTKGAEDFIGDGVTSEKGQPGQVVVDFYFSGDFITQNVGNTKATIEFSGGREGNASNTSNIFVGLEGQKFSSVSTLDRLANTAAISGATIPANGKLSVVLYKVEQDGNDPKTLNTPYNIRTIKVNGFEILPTSRSGNELTKAIDVAVINGQKSSDKNVTINIAAGGKKTATKVLIKEIGTTGNGEGGSTDKSATLPKAGGNVILGSSFSATTSEVKTDSTVKVLTNTYYTLFDDIDNLSIQDAFGNNVNMEATALADNYTLTTSDATCAIVKMNDGTEKEPSTIFFKDCAAGKEIAVIITAKGSDAANKITFTNIFKSSENTKFNVSINVGSETYNVANNDVVIKVVGDGNTKADKTDIIVTSDNKDAKITLRPVKLLNGSEFTSLVKNGKLLSQSIESSGNYYVIRSDLKGKVTVQVDSTIPKAEAKSKKDTPISGTLSFDVTLVDLVAPTAKVKATSSGFILTITDVSLNEVATTAEVYKDGVLLKALTGSKGVYTAKVPQGLYSVKVHAEDISGNTLNKSYPILVGQAGTSATIESSLIAKGTYEIAGTFTSHDFADKNAAFDWVYTDNKGVSYQLLGKTPTATDLFGWKEVDLKPTSKDWSMIELTGDNKGPLGWVLVDNDTKAAFKLQGAKADNTFEFSSALYINVTIDGSNVKFTKK